ncbi:hypothetical protein CYPRO_0488 [Cyclonatronum proteinivorum]|uniref:Uncharacterized protein n=1 Tax=Cyclonatronum proteinivorum TaxID=1457365 RepID=A0A345UH22_9BACT|nr:hypothetical protein [Cyclonatronum proteinivorum]AXI99773.1 hypothetical protein CYPRO_0488 [Cyclonatronum proteinivorum]
MHALTQIIVPQIIVGLLILLIFNVQLKMMDSSVENQVMADLQNRADTGVLLLQEYARDIRQVELAAADSLSYLDAQGNNVVIFRDARLMKVQVTEAGTNSISTYQYNLMLSAMVFEMVSVLGQPQAILRVHINTESTPEMEPGTRTHRYRAFATRDIFLRNAILN